jgi:1L-myo-inositol 1-phosphate cytidylyltransferase
VDAVILAAGDGGRLRPHTLRTPKPLLRIAGRPIINHVLDNLRAAGVSRATVVVGYRAEQMRAAIDNLHSSAMRVRVVENDGYMLGNARSLWTARRAVDGPFVLAMADHLVEPALVRALLAGARDRCRLAVDFAAPDDPRAEEATRALVRRGRVVELGKMIERWNALDTGLFYCTPAVFDAFTRTRRDGELGAIFGALARAGDLDAVDVTGCSWMDIDTPEDFAAARAMIEERAINALTDELGHVVA